jgi:WD40 repeat protein
MDLKFTSEFSGLAYCLHPKNPSLFILSQQTDHLVILEVDLYTKAMCRSYYCPDLHFDRSSKGRGGCDKYFLFFLESKNQLMLVSPLGLVAFFDYESSALIAVIKLRGRHNHSVGTFCFHPGSDKLTLFYTAETLKPIYALTLFNVQGKLIQESKKRIQKLTNTVLQLGCHPTANLLYGACSDGCVHVWDYELEKELTTLIPDKSILNKAAIGSCLNIDNRTKKLAHGNAYGYISVWDLNRAPEEHVDEFVVKRSFGAQALSWLAIMHSDKYQYLLVTFSNGSLTMFKYIYAERKTKAKMEEVCTLFQGEQNFPAPFNVDRTNFILSHPVLPFITSTWLKSKTEMFFKSTVFLIYQGTSQGTEIAVLFPL